jgi:predicted flap endonuclease-1-like 5' DNA nuclease
MSADLTAYLPLIVIALALLAVLVWIISRSTRRARVVADESGTPLARDVLAEGAAPAPRNQALIDAPRVIAPTPPTLPVAEPEAVPTAEPAPAPVSPTSGDDLTRIKGLGPKLAALLGELGVTRFAQIAAWTPEEIARIDAKLGRFAGRIVRDQWVEQAKLLAAGDESGFTGRFGNNG